MTVTQLAAPTDRDLPEPDDVVLTTHKLTKTFGRTVAVDAVDITLRRGRIYGLIGRNGSGKTSLMRLLTGLSRPTSGGLTLFGADRLSPQVLRRLGCLIEEPGLRPSLTAAQNLRLHRIIRGVPDPAVEAELLGLVGLAGTGRKKVRDFSLGMRQRLGIAIALLTDPELLILDEPVNGLDPQGVVEIRQLLRRLATEREITILISSHNLPELFQTATDYILVDAGAVRRSLTLEELEAQTQHALRIGCSAPERLVQVLEQVLGTRDFTVLPDGQVRLAELGRLVDRLFEYASLLHDDRGPEVTEVELTGLVTDVLLDAVDPLQAAGLDVDFDPDSRVRLVTDQARVTRIVRNLVRNAAQHGRSTLRVRVRPGTWQGRAAAVIALTNEVDGQVKVDRLFDRFYTGDGSRSGRTSGLGLAIVARLAEQLGGRARARQDGAELTLEVTLPELDR